MKTPSIFLAAVRSTGGAALALLFVLALVRSVLADEFRIESKVFSAKDEAPTSESLTLFDDGRVYDFLTSPREITVFDISRSRIVLLDPERNSARSSRPTS